eukprot:g660.t1
MVKRSESVIAIFVALACTIAAVIPGVAGQGGSGGIGAATDPRQYLQEIFSGDLEGLAVSGSATVKSETDLELRVKLDIESNGWTMGLVMGIRDQRCDYRNVQFEAGLKVTFPKTLTSQIMLACTLLRSTACDNFNGTVGLGNPISETLNLLPEAGPAGLKNAVIDDRSLATPAVRTALDFFGVDVKVEIVEPHFMLAGTNFSLLMTVNILNPDTAGICNNQFARKALQQLDENLCEKPIISVDRSNVGLDVRQWLKDGDQPFSWIDEKGVFVIGEDSLQCVLKPSKFQIKVKGSDVTDSITSAEWRSALVKAVNSRLPENFKINENALSDLDITRDASGNIVVSGGVFAGAGKDPAALLKALRDFLSSSSNELPVGNDGKVVKITIDEDQGGDADYERCKSDPRRVAAGACDPDVIPGPVFVLPPADTPSDAKKPSFQPGDADKGAGREKHAAGALGTVGIVLLTIAITLVVVLVGIIVWQRRGQMSGGRGVELDNIATATVVDDKQPRIWSQIYDGEEPSSSA